MDDPAAKERWFPGITAAQLLDHPFATVSEADRATIRGHMLAKGQLDAAAYPSLSAELREVKARPSQRASKHYAYEAIVALTVHGKTVERPFAVNLEFGGDAVHVEAAGAFRFSDFGITPYSALLGAVRNQDAFQVFVDFQAKRVPEADAATPAAAK